MAVNKALALTYVTLVWLLLLAGLSAAEDNLRQLNLNKQKWSDLNWRDYSYTYQQSCFCALDYTRAMRVKVENNQPVSAYFIDTKAPVPAYLLKDIEAIEQLFVVLFDALQNKADRFIVSYHKDYGFPEHIDIDQRLRRADDERTIAIADLTKAGPD